MRDLKPKQVLIVSDLTLADTNFKASLVHRNHFLGSYP
jgi:hypothetical protein